MLRYKVKYTSKPISFNIPLMMGGLDFIDYKEDHENEFIDQKNNSINPILSSEVVRFKPTENTSQINVSFNGSFTYTNAGFTMDEISSFAETFVNSNYIVQVYDSFDSTKQTLLHTSYINGYNILTSDSSEHNILLSTESYAIYLPKSFIETVDETFELYFKFLFYNAKTGSIFSFSQDIPVLTNENQLYFQYTFTKSIRKYSFPSTIVLKELPTSQYTEIVTNTVSSIKLEKPIYPTGNNFTIDGTYSQID